MTSPAPSGKQCGDCSLCCKTMVIHELSKPKDVWCSHFSRKAGCEIYPDRPPSCRTFSCYWLLDPAMGPEWKPNKCKMVLAAKENTLVVHVDPGADQPWRREPYFSQLVEKATRNIRRGAIVLVMEHGRTRILLPSGDIDLGVLGPDDRIALAQVGTGWQARVVGAAEADQAGLAVKPA